MDESLIESVKIKEKIKEKKQICVICEDKKAEFFIKGIPKDCYCYDCAIENFGSIDLLEKLN